MSGSAAAKRYLAYRFIWSLANALSMHIKACEGMSEDAE